MLAWRGSVAVALSRGAKEGTLRAHQQFPDIKMALSDDYRRVSPPSTSAPYLALGILSSALERFQTHRGGETSGKFALRRETIRTSWLRHPAINHTISAHFILRCGGLDVKYTARHTNATAHERGVSADSIFRFINALHRPIPPHVCSSRTRLQVTSCAPLSLPPLVV